MLVYDLEIGKYDWLVGVYNGKEYTQIHNDYEAMTKFYEEHQEDIWIGYNSADFDCIILKLILLEKIPEAIFEYSQRIIKSHDAGKTIKKTFNMYNMKLYDLDLMPTLKLFASLKELEGYLGWSIHETTVSFDLDRPWTEAELEEMKTYNRHDLDATWAYANIAKDTISARIMLIKEYNLPKSMISSTNAQITAEILGAEYTKFTDGKDPYDIKTAPIELNKYKECADFFTTMPEMDEKAKKELMIADCPHTVACGGLHGALLSYFYIGKMWMVDVASYYPNMMLNFNLTPRSQKDPNAYRNLVERRMKVKSSIKTLKAEGKDSEAKHAKILSNILKLPINTVSGCMKAPFSKLFDQKHNNYMCITGQLLLIDLIEHIEPYCKLIQSNTDGILIIPIDEEACDKEIKYWEDKTGLFMEKTVALKVYQKDVNNYAMLTEDGSIKVKGGYVGQYYNDEGGENHIRRNLEIIDKAIVDFLLYNKSVEETVKNPMNPLIKYQIVKKLGSMYNDPVLEKDGDYIPLPNRCNRVFATVDTSFGKVKKRKTGKDTWDNVEGLPEHCLIYNDSIKDMIVRSMDELDLDWYVNLAKSKIVDYVLETSEKTRGKKKSLEVDWSNVLKKLGR